MCVAIPLKITEIQGNDGIGERDGVRRSIRLDFIKNPKPGEYVIVHAGFAIERIDEAAALEALSIAAEIRDELVSAGQTLSFADAPDK